MIIKLQTIFIALHYSEFFWSGALAVPKSLQAVQILMRHGDRKPDHTMNTGATGELTEKGKLDMYNLGVYLRQKYSNWVKNCYDNLEVDIVTSDKYRNIMSAMLLSNGFYQLKKSAIGESAIPVRSIPGQLDKYLQCTKPCPRYNILSGNALGHFAEAFIFRNRRFVDIFVNKTGDYSALNTALDGFDRVASIGYLQEDVLYNISQEPPVEDWAQEVITNPEVLGVKTATFISTISTPEMQMLYNGPFLKLMLDKFETRSLKITFFVGHDRNLFTLMYSLGIWDDDDLLIPPPSSTLMIELHKDEEISGSQFYLQFWYRNTSSVPPRLLLIPKCRHPCYLELFKTNFKDVIPDDDESLCEIEVDDDEVAGAI